VVTASLASTILISFVGVSPCGVLYKRIFHFSSIVILYQDVSCCEKQICLQQGSTPKHPKIKLREPIWVPRGKLRERTIELYLFCKVRPCRHSPCQLRNTLCLAKLGKVGPCQMPNVLIYQPRFNRGQGVIPTSPTRW